MNQNKQNPQHDYMTDFIIRAIKDIDPSKLSKIYHFVLYILK